MHISVACANKIPTFLVYFDTMLLAQEEINMFCAVFDRIITETQ